MIGPIGRSDLALQEDVLRGIVTVVPWTNAQL